MNYLLVSLASSPSLRAKELAISAIGATASAAEKQIVPYFQQIIDQLKGFLQSSEDEAQLKVQTQAIGGLCVLLFGEGEGGRGYQSWVLAWTHALHRLKIGLHIT